MASYAFRSPVGHAALVFDAHGNSPLHTSIRRGLDRHQYTRTRTSPSGSPPNTQHRRASISCKAKPLQSTIRCITEDHRASVDACPQERMHRLLAFRVFEFRRLPGDCLHRRHRPAALREASSRLTQRCGDSFFEIVRFHCRTLRSDPPRDEFNQASGERARGRRAPSFKSKSSGMPAAT